ncbi:o-succinylbenzoate--CoA ligase [Aquibacillus albus]|uniref:2-succinylbenzoate--CoA ligase n=1 Tax=Aquibacillus albus TaxID=1168171 RepID=A0ABS2MYE7_9BACI|nr:o-succinylbenzoate--CoA ligase [Aquibacillus albus]MBM7570906.1 O-succinylbenzoic acid--CoA ligase [Aquibacillus albus]
MTVETMPHWLDKRADLTPHEIAIEDSVGPLTFEQLQRYSKMMAKKLANVGVLEGDHVAIFSNNSADYPCALYALSYLGAVAVLINTRLSPKEIAYQLNDAEVSLLFTSSEMHDVSKRVIAKADKDIELRAIEALIIEKEKQVPLKEEINLNDLFTIVYTSGTTGSPKGVMHTYGNHWWSAVSSALNLGLNEKDKWLAALPLFHVGGLSILMKSVIYGMPVYLLDKFDVEQVHDAIMNKQVTSASVVAVMLERLMERLDGSHYPETFRCMLLGGGPAPKPLLEKAKAARIPVYQTYGMTETSSQIVTLSPQYALTKLGSAGKALFPAQLKIVNEGGSEQPAMCAGEILVKGPMVTGGYYQNSEANKQAFQQDWLATGDIGYLDEEGFLYVLDRRKDLIISGGENVYPAEVESVLLEMDGIKEVGVVGKEDDAWGQVPVAFVVKSEEAVTDDQIINHCHLHLAKFKVPKAVYFVDSLPRNASNKLLRTKLVDRLKNF